MVPTLPRPNALSVTQLVVPALEALFLNVPDATLVSCLMFLLADLDVLMDTTYLHPTVMHALRPARNVITQQFALDVNQATTYKAPSA
jgi:hypothetical protein